ncbi:MAG: transposase, partial [Actinomycetota bacterium]|nr:transposase [Actinomycetota bacterium]
MARRPKLTDAEREQRRAADRERLKQAAEQLLTSEGWQRWVCLRSRGPGHRRRPRRCPGGGRTRPLETIYPIVYFDAMMVKVREDRSVRSRACYLAVGVTVDGDREALGIWW